MSRLFTVAILKWVSGGLLFFSLLLGAALVTERIHASKLQSQLTACSEGRRADAASYRAAQEQAQRLNIEQVRRVESRQQELNNEASRTLSARLERLRGELRSQGGTAQGHPGSPGSPQAGDPTGTPDSSWMCYPPETVLRAGENEERHSELVQLINQTIKLLNEEQ